ncbi:MAG: hypothetical protein VB025_09175 [Sphaerochaeta sp.]|nr:hypothetical protein [Sphaerochaeta sp.]
MKVSIARTGKWEPDIFDFEGQEDADKPFVEYRLLTGEQVEEIQSGRHHNAWAKIWRDQVTKVGNLAFEIDGVEQVPGSGDLPIKKIPDLPGSYTLYYAVAHHILAESVLSSDHKKKLQSTTAS